MASWLKCTARRGGGAIHVNLENAVSVYWSERDKATVIAFIGGEKHAVFVEEKRFWLGAKPWKCSEHLRSRPTD